MLVFYNQNKLGLDPKVVQTLFILFYFIFLFHFVSFFLSSFLPFFYYFNIKYLYFPRSPTWLYFILFLSYIFTTQIYYTHLYLFSSSSLLSFFSFSYIFFFIMYFDLPTAHERNSESPDSNNKNKKPIVADERLIEIINNIQDHWGSPPIMTPETLAYVLNNQWVKDHQLMPLDSPRLTVLNTRANHPQENEKERDGLASEPTASSVLNLVTELCR
ncbi:hypothetical protein F4703DRAFT_1211130 [Phycomyces blakesleeanus]